ncbi:ROK family protein [Peribacillus sp. NPDC060253]|uniref:ROK family protein n=1 Tax=Peribacillus sp. NPDC060253 TaxID=3347084 RepID=UPI00364E0F60
MDEQLYTPKNLRIRILHGIRLTLIKLGSATKVELSQKLDISFPTVSKMIVQMEKSGEVLVVGLDKSSGGRRAHRYAYNPEHMLGMSILLEKEETACTIFNCFGEVKEQGVHKSIIHDDLDSLKRLIGDTLAQFPEICAIAIGVPGSVENGRIIYIPGYEKFLNLDLQSCLEETFTIPVVLENDMNAAILGYHNRTEKFQEKQSIVYIYLGHNGPGAGLLINGDVVRGSSFFTGEISFVPLYDDLNFLQAVKQEKESKKGESIESLSRLIASMTAIINPHAVIFSKAEVSVEMLNRLKKESAKYVPMKHLPNFALSEWREDYLHGLQHLALEQMLSL